MRTAARIVGIVVGVIGGVLDVGLMPMAWIFGGGWGLAAALYILLLCIAATAGGVLADTRPVASSLLLITSGLLGFMCLLWVWALPGIMLIVAGILEKASIRRAARAVSLS